MSINIEITGRDFDLQVIKNFMLVVTIVYLDNFTTVSNTDINRQEIKWHISFFSTKHFCILLRLSLKSYFFLKASFLCDVLVIYIPFTEVRHWNDLICFSLTTTRAILPHMKYMQIYIHKGDEWYVDQWFHMRS